MRLKCDDGIVREFSICVVLELGYDYLKESECKGCGTKFGYHDTKILKPKWKKHRCKPSALEEEKK